MDEANDTTFGARLRQLRRACNLSRERLGFLAGCTGRAVGHYETGSREPTGRVLLALADALGVSPHYLLLGRST